MSKVLIDFYATWCGPCQTMAPILDKISEDRSDLEILKIDIDKNPRMVQTFHIRSVPMLVFMQDGKEKWRRSGILSTRILTELLDS